MDHDPLCPTRKLDFVWDATAPVCSLCDLIALVAERERARIRAGVKAIDPVEWALNPEPAVLAVIDAGGKSVPRIITADDPEPALRSIVTDLIGDAWQSYLSEGGSVVWASTSEEEFLWVDLLALGPITLIHDAGGE